MQKHLYKDKYLVEVNIISNVFFHEYINMYYQTNDERKIYTIIR